jgi:hypothetical protein
MKNHYFFIILLFLPLSTFSQKYTEAVVTDVNFLRRTIEGINEYTFPFYFENEERNQLVLNEIKNQIKLKYNIDDVAFNYNSIKYKEAMFEPKTNLKNYNKKGHDKTLFLSIESILQLGTSISTSNNHRTVYRLTTSVNVVDNKNKSKYKFRNNIPFYIKLDNDEFIYAPEEINKEDFFKLYVDGICAAFDGKEKKSKKRKFIKPTSNYYDNFMNSAEKRYIYFENKSYLLGKPNEEPSDALIFNYSLWKSMGVNEYDLGFFKKNNDKSGYKLQNLLNEEDYVVKFTTSSGELFNFISTSSGVEIQFLQEKSNIGSFNLDEWTEIDGDFDGINYRAVYTPEYDVTEIIANNNLIGIFKDLTDKRLIYLNKSISRKEYGNIFNLLFAYDFAIMLKEKNEAETNME